MAIHQDEVFQIIAHRGASHDAPENTMAAFQMAAEQGAHAIEMDLHITKDHELVVCHDPTVDRTTNGKGKIAHLKYQELQQLDAGGWFHDRFRGEPIPHLKEVYEKLPAQLWFNLEVKMRPEYKQLGLEEQLASYLSENRRWQRTVISSFDLQTLIRLKELEPRLHIAFLYEKSWYKRRSINLQLAEYIYSIHPRHTHMTATEARLWSNQKVRIYPWTVNNPLDMKKWMERGAAGLITDRPQLLRQMLIEDV